jgi:hypothetical protein
MPSACSFVSLPFSTSLSNVFRRPTKALSTASRAGIEKHHLVPGLRGHLRNAAAHGAGADHGDLQ